MNQYTFNGGIRTMFLAFMGVGLLCLGLTWMMDIDEFHSRFWTNILHNSVYFVGIAIMATFFLAANITAYAGWYVTFKRILESITAYLLPGFIIMALIGLAVFMHLNHLYHWTDTSIMNPEDKDTFDPIITGKSSFLNKYWYLISTVVIGAVYIFIASKLRSLSQEEDEQVSEDGSFKTHRTIRKYAAAFLPIFGFTSVVLIWQWVMSVDAHWYSTMFAWYCLASLFVSMLCVTILITLYLRSKGLLPNVSQHHIHDLGKFLFGISVFWMYLWFSQYMLIWYANIGEETIYFKERYDNYPVLFFGNIIINFAIPFLVLLRNDTKWKNGSLIFISVLAFLGHWMDFFLMIKPGVLHTAHEAAGHGTHNVGEASHGAAEVAHEAAAHGNEVASHAEHVSSVVSGFSYPGLLELGTMLGFVGLFGFVVFTALSKVKLTAKQDPYYKESVNHHV